MELEYGKSIQDHKQINHLQILEKPHHNYSVKECLEGYLNLKKRRPPIMTNEKQATSRTTKNLQEIKSID